MLFTSNGYLSTFSFKEPEIPEEANESGISIATIQVTAPATTTTQSLQEHTVYYTSMQASPDTHRKQPL